MRQPYYEEIGVEVCYSNDDLLEQVYDDRTLEEDDHWLDWEILDLEESDVLE